MTRSPDRREIIKQSRHWRRRERLRRVLLWFGILLLISAEIFWLVHRDFLLIDTVAVEGAAPSLATEIRVVASNYLSKDYLNFLPRRNIWFYPKFTLMAELRSAFSAINDLSITKSAEKSLVIKVKEKRATYLWCDEDQTTCYLLDQNGIAFASAPQFSGHSFFEFYSTLPTTIIGSSPLPAKEFKEALELRSGLNQVLANSVIKSSLLSLKISTFEWRYILENKLNILVSSLEAPEVTLTKLQSALVAPAFIQEYKDALAGGEHLEYLDLRFGGKVFYKFGS